jgi:protein gp37
MGDKSKIEWTDATWNPTTGCTWAGPECDHCYAVPMTKRLAAMGQEKYQGLTTDKHFNGVMKTHPSTLDIPVRWKKPRKIFVNSMSDLFHKDVPFVFIAKVFAVMALTPRHTYQVLTKRPERAIEFFKWLETQWAQLFPIGPPDEVIDANVVLQFVSDAEVGCQVSDDVAAEPWPLPNVWLGVSTGTQKAALERIPLLAKIPAAVRFVSAEPLLEQLDMFCGDGDWGLLTDIHQVIAGGESGPGARPMHPAWPRLLRDQCLQAAVAFHFKQWGEWAPDPAKWHGLGPTGIPPQLCVSPKGETAGGFMGGLAEQREAEGWVPMERKGKKAAGRLLDGREWNEMPTLEAVR